MHCYFYQGLPRSGGPGSRSGRVCSKPSIDSDDDDVDRDREDPLDASVPGSERKRKEDRDKLVSPFVVTPALS